MAKNLNVNLTFKADSSQAKSQIVELQGLLNKVALGTNVNINPTQMKEASAAAKELALHLNNAYNATTGNFDLSKLDRSLKTTGSNISQLSTKLLNAGATGQQAFVKLAQTIAAADRPMITLNSRLSQMWTTLQNTARWQLSSSLLHGFIGAVQGAYGYAQDLNESLNNIRIVTGQNIDQMSRFAEEANKAAKALSATTTDYTDAALIYYQQGLSDKEVAERAEATIKMANVSRQSAEIVSDQMTAIWNNFYDGSQSLEYYGDVITELGAKTASSSEEIAQGLEKFAAVADTVGLSYEYATSALATVTATTRQSADVVGTAFKTLFARIQDLELGETLDDGVTLGKYSEALNAVGISIMDQNGQLLEMDAILDKMGDKWGQLTKAQQVSLAQTVAGTRQYTQLVALMDNWSFFQENLSSAMTSEGALQEQADIYAESWEAAQKRVKASAEAIYSDIMDDEFFIDITDGFSGLLDGIDAFIDGVGGIGPLIGGIASMLLGTFAYKLPEALNGLKHTFLVTFQGAQKQANALSNSMNQTTNSILMNKSGDLNVSMKTALQNTVSLNNAKSKLMVVQKSLNNTEAQAAQQEMNLIEMYQAEAQAISEVITTLKAKIDTEISDDMYSSSKQGFDMQEKYLSSSLLVDSYDDIIQWVGAADAAYGEFLNTLREAAEAEQKQLQLKNTFSELGVSVQNLKNSFNIANDPNSGMDTDTWARLTTQANDYRSTLQGLTGVVPGLKDSLDGLGKAQTPKEYIAALDQLEQALLNAENQTIEVQAALNSLQKIKGPIGSAAKSIDSLTKEQKKLKNMLDQVNKAVEQFNPKHTVTGLERITAAAAGLGQVAMLATSVRSVFQAWNNDDLTFGEKLTTTFMSISMILPSLIGAVKSFKTVADSSILSIISLSIAQRQYKDALSDSAVQQSINTVLSKQSSEADKKAAMATLMNSVATKGLATEEEKELAVKGLLTSVKSKELILDQLVTKAKNGSVLATVALSLAQKLGITTTNAATAATMANAAAIYAHPIGWILGVIMAVIAGIALLVIGIKTATDAWNADAKAAKEAAETARELAEASDEARQEVENLKSAFEDYDTAFETLSQMTSDMEGYQDAVKAVNQEVLNLIEKYPELAKLEGILKGEPGAYSFNREAIDNFITGKEQAAQAAQAAAIVSQAKAGQAQAVSDRTNLARQIGRDLETKYTNINAGDSKKNIILYNTTNQFALQKGQLDLAELLEGEILDSLTNLGTEEKFREKLTEYLKSLGDMPIETIETIVEGLVPYQAEIDRLAQNASGAANALDTATKIIRDTYLGEDAREGQSEEWTAAYNEALNNYSVGKINRYSDEDDQDLVKLLQDAGMDFTRLSTENTVIKKDGRLYVQFKDGSEESLEAIQTKAAQNYAIQEANKTVKQGTDTFTGLNTQLQNYNISLDENVSVASMNSLLGRLEKMKPEDAKLVAEALVGKTGIEAEKIIDEILQVQPQSVADKINVSSAKDLDFKEEDIENIEYYAESLLASADAAKETGKAVNGVSKDLKDNAKVASTIAIANARMNRGLLDLAENFADYEKTLSEGNKTSIEYQKALKGISDTMNDVLGLDDVELSRDFLSNTDNLNLMAEAAKGNTQALEQLRAAAAKDIIQNIELRDESLRDKLNYKLQELQWHLDATELTIGTNFDDKNILAGLNAIIQQAGISAEQIQDYFNAIGYVPTVEMETIDQVVTNSGIIPHVVDNGSGGFEVKYIPYSYEETKQVSVPKITSLDYTGNADVTVDTSALGNAHKSKSGSPSSWREQTKRGSGDRYKEIEDQLDDIAEAAEDVNRELDKMFGAGRLKEIDKLIKLQEKEIDQLERKKSSAENYLIKDKNSLSEAAANAGVTFTLENGNITNYNEQMDALYAKLNAKEKALRGAQEAGKDTEALEEEVEYLEKLIDKLEEAVGQYDETRELIEDIDDQIAEARDEILALNYQKITEKLELQIELNDADLKRIERQIAALGDDLFARAEAATLMAGYGNEYEDALQAYESYAQELEAAYAAGEISQADYIEGLKQVQQGYWDNIDALREWKAEMKEYYADTLVAGDNKFQQYMDFMTHPTEIMEHYDNILDLTGGEKDYKAKGVLYEGIAANRQNEVESRTAYYNMLQEQADEQRRQFEALDPSDEAYEYAKAEWEAAQELANQAQEDMLSAVEAWAEAINQVLENELAAAADELEKALTNGSSFDAINTSMERAKSLSEEWLDNTNKIYETNKLMRTAQQALDKTTNQAAKNRLQAFIDETQQMQDQGELSKFELELQQARYDLLLAEIALEEAQNAKSTVRLQRDSEGNFGYVYTADQDNIAAAQQAYDDADNNLYNLGLEGYQEYTEKYMQTQEEFYKTITDLDYKYRVEKSISEEEYNQAMLDAQKYYGEKLADYTYLAQAGMMAQSFDQFQEFKDGWNKKKSELDTTYKGREQELYADLVGYAQTFNENLKGENAIRENSWATTFDNMKVTGEDWKVAMETYTVKVNEAFAQHQKDVEAVNAAVGLSMDETGSRADSLETQVRELKDESNRFKEQIIGNDGNGGLVKALKDEYNAVDKVTQSFQDQLPDIEALERKYEDLAWDIQDTINKLLQLDGTHVETSHTHTETTIYEEIGGKGSSSPNTSPNTNPDPPSATQSQPSEQQIYLYQTANMAPGSGQYISMDTLSDASSVGNLNSYGSHYVSWGSGSGYISDIDYQAWIAWATGLTTIPGLSNPPKAQTSSQTSKYGGGGGGAKAATFVDFSFDTGGYTGSWGPEGKIAMLHQKELVLNAADTENMLLAVSIVRDLMSMFDPGILASLTSPFMNMNSLNSNTLEQSVKIEASFPSVTDRYEIEEALGNLINTASQFANRKHL